MEQKDDQIVDQLVEQSFQDLTMLKQLFPQHDEEYLDDILAQSEYDVDQAMDIISSMEANGPSNDQNDIIQPRSNK